MCVCCSVGVLDYGVMFAWEYITMCVSIFVWMTMAWRCVIYIWRHGYIYKCIWIYVYTYIYINMYIICTCICICIHIVCYMYMYMYVYTYMWMYMLAWVCTYADTCVYLFWLAPMYGRVCIYTHVHRRICTGRHIYICGYVHVYLYICLYVQTCIFISARWQ